MELSLKERKAWGIECGYKGGYLIPIPLLWIRDTDTVLGLGDGERRITGHALVSIIKLGPADNVSTPTQKSYVSISYLFHSKVESEGTQKHKLKRKK